MNPDPHSGPTGAVWTGALALLSSWRWPPDRSSRRPRPPPPTRRAHVRGPGPVQRPPGDLHGPTPTPAASDRSARTTAASTSGAGSPWQHQDRLHRPQLGSRLSGGPGADERGRLEPPAAAALRVRHHAARSSTSPARSVYYAAKTSFFSRVAHFRLDLRTNLVTNITAVGSPTTAAGRRPEPERERQEVLFVHNPTGRGAQIALMNTDGTSRRAITSLHLPQHRPSPSPDGKRFVTASYRGYGKQVAGRPHGALQHRDAGVLPARSCRTCAAARRRPC